MRRVLLVLTVAAVMAAIVALSAGSAFAYANHPTGQGSGSGQSKAAENCTDAVSNQFVGSGAQQNAHQTGSTGPANCDHFFQE